MIVARVVALSLLSVLVATSCSRSSSVDAPSTDVATASSDAVATTSLATVSKATAADIKAVTGPDICTVQIWAATAFERANGRPDDKALLDRVAWNLAVDRVTKALTTDPHADREKLISSVVEELKLVYKTPKLAECKAP